MNVFKPLALSCAIALGVAACATTTSPTGRTQSVGAVSQQQLNQMGAQAFAQLKSRKQQSNDSRQRGYVSCVVNAVVAQLPADQRRMGWESAVFVDNTPNAFALPGGKVGVNTGLLKVAKDQDQLAAVIGHELGHVISRHAAERVSQQFATETALQIANSATSGQRQQLLGLLGAGAQAGVILPFSRKHESEADVLGQRYMAQAGFDPNAAAALWQNMIAASGNNRAPALLSTHPDPQQRIRALQAAAPGLMPAYQQARAAGRKPACR